MSNDVAAIVSLVFSKTGSAAQVEEGFHFVKCSRETLLQSNQLSLLLMQMFGLAAEHSVQCATLLWQSIGGQGSVLALAWSLWAGSLSEPACIVVFLPPPPTPDR